MGLSDQDNLLSINRSSYKVVVKSFNHLNIHASTCLLRINMVRMYLQSLIG